MGVHVTQDVTVQCDTVADFNVMVGYATERAQAVGDISGHVADAANLRVTISLNLHFNPAPLE
jgi:hypothetical protein